MISFIEICILVYQLMAEKHSASPCIATIQLLEILLKKDRKASAFTELKAYKESKTLKPKYRC